MSFVNDGRIRFILAVSFVALVTFGTALLVYRRINQFQAAADEALCEVKVSPIARATLGDSMSVGWFVRGKIIADGGNGTADILVPVRGTKGNGTLLEWAQEEAGVWRICSLSLRDQSGKLLVITSDENTRCERE